jgi:molybdate transport system substrate-binding protein
VSVGSTGKLYAQIRHGAPFEVFFAADVERPRLLEEKEVAVPGTRVTYAIGRLALWVPGTPTLEDPEAWIRAGGYSHLAVANPKLAPYGVAARKVLRGLRMWRTLKPKLVRGENIGQAFHFVASGAAQGGFVALSQVRRPGSPPRGATWEIPADRHPVVEQQAVLLFDAPGPRAFLDYVVGEEAHPLLEAYGYGIPPP